MSQKQIEEITLDVVQHQAASQKLIHACQLRAAQNFEAQAKAERQKAEQEQEASKIVAERTVAQSLNWMRPSLLYRPTLEHNGEEWVVRYGDLSASGPTPDSAHFEFDRLWVGKDEL